MDDLPAIDQIMAKVPPEVRRKYQSTGRYSDDRTSRAERECTVLNDTPGNLPGYNCPACLNRGFVYVPNGDYVITRDCSCMDIRRSLMNVERSGIKQQLERCTFNNFDTGEPWQAALLSGAKRFLHDHTGKWFFAGGQVGCGKTHICTALCGEFLKSGIAVRYMLWRDEIVKLKATVTDSNEYDAMIYPLKKAPVLYVDDFFKTGDNDDGSKKRPTQADVNVAFELLNYRYNNPELITIISTERSVDDLLSCDEATGSRIYERTKEYCYYFRPDRKKNYRLR